MKIFVSESWIIWAVYMSLVSDVWKSHIYLTAIFRPGYSTQWSVSKLKLKEEEFHLCVRMHGRLFKKKAVCCNVLITKPRGGFNRKTGFLANIYHLTTTLQFYRHSIEGNKRKQRQRYHKISLHYIEQYIISVENALG